MKKRRYDPRNLRPKDRIKLKKEVKQERKDVENERKEEKTHKKKVGKGNKGRNGAQIDTNKGSARGWKE